MAGWAVLAGFDMSWDADGKGDAVVVGGFPTSKKRLEAGVGAEVCGADVVEALSCGFSKKGLFLGALVVGVGTDEAAVDWLPREKPLDAGPGDETVGAEDAGADGLAKLKAGAVVAACEEDAAEVEVWPPSWKGFALLSAVVFCGLFRLLKSPPAGCVPPLSPKRVLPPLAESKILGAADVDVVVGVGLLEGCGMLLKRDGAVEEDVDGFPNRFLSSPWGLPKEKGVAEEAPTLVLGGGPAGVVEFPNMEVVGLLVGVVVD